MQVSATGLDLIEAHEGFRAAWYRCPAGVWTIGYGITEATLTRLTGNTRQSLPRVNRVVARELLGLVLRRDVLPAIEKHVTVPLTQGQTDALASFVYNVGGGAFRRSTLLKKLNAGDTGGAAQEFARWNRGGGRVLTGLIRRRAEEAALFQS